MEKANFGLCLAALVWLAFCVIGRELIHDLYSRGSGVVPAAAGQIDYYLVWPMAAFGLLMAAGWIGNMYARPGVIRVASLVLGLAALPYLFFYTGGM